MRFVPKNRQWRDPETDAYLGLSGAGFALRADDRGSLSVTWIEFFGDAAPDNIRAGAKAFRATLDSKKLPAEGVFACAIAGHIVEAAASHQKSVRVVHAPVPGNEGHAEVRHFTDEDLGLLDLLAAETFTEVHFVKDLGLPK